MLYYLLRNFLVVAVFSLGASSSESRRAFLEVTTAEHRLLRESLRETQRELQTVRDLEYRYFLECHARGLIAILSVGNESAYAHLSHNNLRNRPVARRLSFEATPPPRFGSWQEREQRYVGTQWGDNEETDEEEELFPSWAASSTTDSEEE